MQVLFNSYSKISTFAANLTFWPRASQASPAAAARSQCAPCHLCAGYHRDDYCFRNPFTFLIVGLSHAWQDITHVSGNSSGKKLSQPILFVSPLLILAPFSPFLLHSFRLINIFLDGTWDALFYECLLEIFNDVAEAFTHCLVAALEEVRGCFVLFSA